MPSTPSTRTPWSNLSTERHTRLDVYYEWHGFSYLSASVECGVIRVLKILLVMFPQERASQKMRRRNQLVHDEGKAIRLVGSVRGIGR